MPLCPSSSRFQVVSASVASAVVMANPVTTTLGRPFPVVKLDDVVIRTPNASFLLSGLSCVSCLSGSVPPKGQGDIVSTEPERVVDGVLVVAITRLARNDIEIDLGVGSLDS